MLVLSHPKYGLTSFVLSQGVYGISSTWISVPFLHFRTFRMLYGISKILRNYTEFRVANFHSSAEFRGISQNFISVTFLKNTYENDSFLTLKKDVKSYDK
jgi:hypothetical protein